MAKKAKARIVPVAIAGSDDLDYLAGAESPPRKLVRVGFGEPIQLSGKEDVDDVLVRVRKEIIRLNLGIGGRGAAPGLEEQHVAPKGNPSKSKGLQAWLKP